METIIAACGLVCSQCDAYRATKANDEAALALVVADWSVRYNITGLTAEHVRCNGCMTEGSPKADHCQNQCGIRKCAVAKEISTCAQCDVFPCPELAAFFDSVGSPQGGAMQALLTAQRDVECGMHSAL